jgi:peptidyl-tRNA hydrolase, PTH1 family
MKLIVGLGNPGKEYNCTRHNLGFEAIDALASKYGVTFAANKKFNADTAETFINGEKIILAKPVTFMNKSGLSVQAIMAYFNITTDRIWVIHDDIDLELGTVRVRATGSSAGHKGIQSIMDNIGTQEFPRFRMGIKSAHCDYLSTEEVVLQPFAKDEEKLMQSSITKVVTEIEKALKEGIEHVSV